MKTALTMLIRVLLAGCLGLAWIVPATAQDTSVQTRPFSYSVTSLPAHVVPYPDKFAGAPNQASRGIRQLLVDRQISLLDAAPRSFSRLVFQPLDAQAVQKAAQLYVFFNPEYQKLELHGVRVTRNGQTVDRTAQVKFELLQRETNLDNQIYDGEVSAVAILTDIRVNDIIEFERSVVGDNPIFKGRFSAMFPLHGPSINESYRLRLIHPEPRVLTLRAPSFTQETTEKAGGNIVHTVLARNVRPISDDSDRPRWFDPQSWVEISEYRDWKNVGHWADDLFKVDGKLTPGLIRQVDSWKASGLTQGQLTAEALRWVQREIRYFGVELGVNSHLPAHPNLTYERRFGDCKDKSLLLVTLLRELGIEARPALVSMERQRNTARLLPGPQAFDHAIVRVQIDGRTHWLDPTLPTQFGTLDDLGAFDYGKALVIGADADELATVGWPSGYANTYEVTDRFEVKDFRQPAELISELTLGRAAADRYRIMRANMPKEEFDRILHSSYLRLFPSATAQGEVEVKDDQARNRFTVIRRYRLPELFDYERGRLQFGANSPLALDILSGPEVPRRATPYDLPYPLEARISQVVVLPENPVRDIPPPSTERTPYFVLKSAFKRDDRELRRDTQISLLKDHVPADAMLAYMEDIQKLRAKSGLSLTLRAGVMSDTDRQYLNKQIQRLNRFGKSRSAALNAQIEAEVGIRQNSLDIESGKLSTRHLARAHADRSVHHDNLEDHDSALRDIDKAIELDPGQVEYVLTKARILSGTGRFAESLALFEELEKEGHGHAMKASDLGAMGRNYLYLGRHADADRAFQQAVQASGATGELIHSYWQHIAAMRSQGKVQSRLEGRMAERADSEWPHPVGRMLLGRLSPEELLEAAKHEDKGIERDQLVEANFYLAQKFLLDGDKARAGDYLDACRELNATPYLEHFFAGIELKEFGERPKGFMKWLKSL